MKTPILTVIATAALTSTHLVYAESTPKHHDWDISVGLATVTMPSYLGDNTNRSLIAPDIHVSYNGRFFASTFGGLGYNLVNHGGWRAGPIVKYHGGRKEDGDEGYFVDDENTPDLQGLGDIDGTAEIGGFIRYNRGPFQGAVELRQGLDGHEGTVGDVSVEYTGSQRIKDHSFFFAVGPHFSVGDSTYHSAFFGVDEQQATRSGLSTYEAGRGLISYGLQGSISVPVTERVSLIGFGSIDVLAEDVADSSLVSTRGSDDQRSAGIVVSVSF